jgi:hypothetical protein
MYRMRRGDKNINKAAAVQRFPTLPHLYSKQLSNGIKVKVSIDYYQFLLNVKMNANAILQ